MRREIFAKPDGARQPLALRHRAYVEGQELRVRSPLMFYSLARFGRGISLATVTSRQGITESARSQETTERFPRQSSSHARTWSARPINSPPLLCERRRRELSASPR